MLRFLFLLFFSFSVYADCPSGESIGNYPSSTSLILCVSYIGSNCVAKCGYSPSSDIAACVQNSGNNGPYRLTGASCTPHDPGSTVDCSLTPTAPECFTTPPDCTATPNDPACSSGGTGTVDCTVTPNDPSCSTGGGSTGGGTTGGGTTGGGIADTGGAFCGTGTGCTFNPKGYFRSASESDSGMHQIHDVLDSLAVVTTYSDNLSNKTLSSISDSVHSLQNETKTNLTNLYNQSFSTNNLLDSIKSSIDNVSSKLPSGSSSGSGSGSIDYIPKLDEINQTLNNMYYYDSQMNSNLNSMRWDTNNLNGIKQSLYNMQDYLSSIDSKLSNSASGSSGTGSSGSDVGTSANPSHVAESSYIRCSDCAFDIQGATQRLDASKAEFSKTIDEIKDRAGDVFAFNFQGSSDISDCFDILPSWVQQDVCVNAGNMWSILASIIFIICVMAAFYIVMGD